MQNRTPPSKQPILVALLIAFTAPVAFLLFYPLRPKTVLQNQSAAIGYIHQLSQLEAEFARKHPDRGFACNLAELPPATVGVPGATNESFSGYRFSTLNCDASSQQAVQHYQLVGLPTDPREQLSSVCTDETTKVWLGANGSAEDCFRKTKPAPPQIRED